MRVFLGLVSRGLGVCFLGVLVVAGLSTKATGTVNERARISVTMRMVFRFVFFFFTRVGVKPPVVDTWRGVQALLNEKWFIRSS